LSALGGLGQAADVRPVTGDRAASLVSVHHLSDFLLCLKGDIMMTLSEALTNARHRRIAIGHFNVSDLVALKAATEVASVREFGYRQITVAARVTLRRRDEQGP
jgi:hypothetical protein